MPRLGKIALMAVCASSLLSLTCELVRHGGFVASFLGHAVGLDHKAVVLAVPIVKIVAAVADDGLFTLVLIIALALGKSWARKTFIVLVVLQVVGLGLDVAASSMSTSLAQGQEDSWHWWDWIGLVMDMSAAILLFARDVRAWYREDASVENMWTNRLQCLVFWTLRLIVSVLLAMMQSVATGIANPLKMAHKFPRIRVAELMARADHGDALSMWRLGNWEKNGWLGEKHPDKAFDWYKKAADIGNKFALTDLGDCYEKGFGTETNLDEAVACWMMAAEKKHPWAACKVAMHYQKAKRQEEALEWFRKSADLGSNYGCCKLGECYEKGWGTETNAMLAAKWFLRGAERRHVWGMEKTGDFYRDGYGVEKDIAKAREWYEKAVKRGSKNAKKKLDALPDERQEDADEEVKLPVKSET